MSGYAHTEVIDAATYDNLGLCQGYVTRRHIDQDVATRASLRCRADFDRALGGFDCRDKVTYENAQFGHLATLVVPMTIPERLDLISYTVEFFCLYDDAEDMIGSDPLAAAERKIALKQMFKRLFAQYVAINPAQGISIAKNLEAFKQMAEAREKDQAFMTFDEYRKYRVDEYGSDFQLAVMMFGSDLDPMTVEESAVIAPLIRLGFSTISLINDLISFDVEWATVSDKDTLVNGVHTLMQLHNIDIDEAKTKLRNICIRQDREFLRRRAELTAQGLLTDRLEKIVEIVALHMAGKIVWGSTSLRYNVDHRLKVQTRKRTDSLIMSPKLVQTSALVAAAKAPAAITITTVEVTPENVA